MNQKLTQTTHTLSKLRKAMSNSFWHHKMEGDQGDLLDIVRASVASSNIHDHHTTTSAFPSLPAQRGGEDFGDPFSNLCVDPLLQNMAGRTSSGVAQEVLSQEMMNQPCNIFSQMLQISPPTTLGLNRRKNQAKKVVCIPAATAASSRHSGEVVPSDLWAWRKYGQKPIKGSPYPRAYYRCSSSKGCSARKQVERSRTDPNMLVITYTSEHKHPKPTQRNALAGSTRVQPPKNITSSPKSSPQDLKEEPPKETMSSISTSIVKEEVCEMEKTMPNQTNDILADLTELDPEPISLIFSDEFIVECTDEERQNKNLDPFNMLNW